MDEDPQDPPAPEEEPLGRELAVNRADLVRGTICLGKRQAATLLREPERRISEVRGLASLLDAYVAFTEAGPQTSAFYEELDSGEKASFSYRFGMGLALLATQAELGVPWLMHAEALQASGTADVEPEDATRTDLLGLSRSGRWHLVKARARSSEITASIVEKARADLAEVATINDRAPAQRRACVTGLGETPFRVSFVPGAGEGEDDDEAEGAGGGDEEPVRYRVQPAEYITEYYAQFSFLARLGTREHTFEPGSGCTNLPPAVLADLEGTDYEIGLLAPLHEALQPPDQRSGSEQSLDEAVPAKQGWEPKAPAEARDAGLSVGRDGVVVKGPPPPG